MTYPRAHLVDPSGGIYHVCSRCVRRAFLCGIDKHTGFNFDHRRQWLEDRIHLLADVFAVDLIGYAVMSNHYHLILKINPKDVQTWSDEDIVTKWLTLFPRHQRSPDHQALTESYKFTLLRDHARLAILRERLSSLSWFMRCLNEPLARLANREDACKGRFWEGRFKSQLLLDEAALLACMVYVDLNPIRAGITTEVENSRHTSVHRRLKTKKRQEQLSSLNRPNRPIGLTITIEDYVTLARWTALSQQGKRPLSTNAQRSLQKANAPNPEHWLSHYLPSSGNWQRAIGSSQSLKDYAQSIGQCWIRTKRVSTA